MLRAEAEVACLVELILASGSTFPAMAQRNRKFGGGDVSNDDVRLGDSGSPSPSPPMLATAPSKTVAIPPAVSVIGYAVCGCMLFCGVVAISSALSYFEVVKNAMYGYPEEKIPSVSACLGDVLVSHWFSCYFLVIATGFRLVMHFLAFLYCSAQCQKLPAGNWQLEALNCLCYGLEWLRLLLIATFVIVTRREWHSRHDLAAELHIVLTAVYLPLCTYRYRIIHRRRTGAGAADVVDESTWWRKVHLIVWYLNLLFLLYFFYLHKVQEVAGSYSRFAVHELVLILLDIAFDCILVFEFRSVRISVTVT